MAVPIAPERSAAAGKPVVAAITPIATSTPVAGNDRVWVILSTSMRALGKGKPLSRERHSESSYSQ
jgi:hypothetical protein